jgi:hypothetical protein
MRPEKAAIQDDYFPGLQIDVAFVEPGSVCLRALLLGLGFVFAALSGTRADGEAWLIRYVPGLEVTDGFFQSGDLVFLNARSQSDQTRRLVALSLATQDIRNIADGLADFRVIAADARHVAIRERTREGKISVIDLKDGRTRAFCCFPSRAWNGYFADNEIRMLARDGKVLQVGSAALTGEGSIRIRDLTGADAIVPWESKLIALYERRPGITKQTNNLVLYNSSLQRVAETQLPSRQARGNLVCQPGDHAIAASRLAYVSDCGRITLIDLDRMSIERTLPYFAQATNYRIAAAGELLFAAPAETGEYIAVFRLSDGMQIARLPIRTNAIAAAGDKLAVLEPDGRIALYQIEVSRLMDVARAREATVERCRSVKSVPSNTPVEAQIALIEVSPVAPFLADLGKLDAKGLECAELYARLLARTIDRIEDGVAILERIHALKPDDTQVVETINAARARLAIREKADTADVPAARSAIELTIGTGAEGLGPQVLLSGSRLYAWQWGDLGDAGITCSTLSLYDRADLQLETIIPVVGCDDDFQDAISSVVEGGNNIYASIQYRFQQEGRTDLVVIHGGDPGIAGRHHLMGGIWKLISSAEGLIACPLMGECRLFDWDNLKAPGNPVTPVVCPPMQTYGTPLLRSSPDVPPRPNGRYVACGERYVAVQKDRGEDATIEIFAREKPEVALAALQAAWPKVAIDEPNGRAVISSTNIETVEFKTVDLKTGTVRPELSLRHDKEGGLPWAAYGDALFVARGKDLVIHDLAKGGTIAYLKDLVSPQHEHSSGGKGHRIQHLIIDEEFSRLIALTRDGHRSRVISLPDLMNDLGKHAPDWSILERAIGGEHADD